MIRSLVRNTLTTGRQLSDEARMSVFKSRVNVVTGEAEWVAEDDLFDYRQETARSAFADMIHDTERNRLYEEGLRRVIAQVKSEGKRANVLDIGTGTGLLSMMAARCGADRVTAIEVFDPMARIAKEIINLNELNDKINIITSRSTDLSGAEIVDKPNILVAEVFDTELIGEGALATFAEAHQRLLQPGCRVVPAKASVWVQPVQSAELRKWNDAPSLPECGIDAPAAYRQCSGGAAVHDLQLDQFEQFVPVCDPVEIFQFDFENADSLAYSGQTTIRGLLTQKCSRDVTVDALLMWWSLDMDGTGQLTLATTPQYRQPSTPNQWRDHWMQAVYYLPKPVRVPANSETDILIDGYHDEYSFWFNVRPNGESAAPVHERPVCTCGLHMICSRANLGRLNDPVRRAAQISALSQLDLPGKTVLAIGDDVLLPVLCQQLGSTAVIAVSSNRHIRQTIADYSDKYSADNLLEIVDSVASIPDDRKIDTIVSSAMFISSMLPWHDLQLWYALNKLRAGRPQYPPPRVCPDTAELWCLPVVFDHLWKIRAPVGVVAGGYDLTPFDRLMNDSLNATEAPVEPQPLWEYPSVSCSSPTKIMTFDLSQPVPTDNTVSDHIIPTDGSRWNGVALWIEWRTGGKVLNGGGLLEDCGAGKRPIWDRHSRQGVYFRPLYNTTTTDNSSTNLSVTITFVPSTGQIDFNIR